MVSKDEYEAALEAAEEKIARIKNNRVSYIAAMCLKKEFPHLFHWVSVDYEYVSIGLHVLHFSEAKPVLRWIEDHGYGTPKHMDYSESGFHVWKFRGLHLSAHPRNPRKGEEDLPRCERVQVGEEFIPGKTRPVYKVVCDPIPEGAVR